MHREATTLFDCLASCDDSLPERSSLVRATPLTGRWHQIRRHCNGLSHPVIGDAKHGDTKVNTYWREERGLRRLGLHCAEMSLPLPDGERLHVQCPPPADLTSVWAQLLWWDDACAALLPGAAGFDATNSHVFAAAERLGGLDPRGTKRGSPGAAKPF